MEFKIGTRYAWGEPGSRSEFKRLHPDNAKFIALMDGFWPFTVKTMDSNGHVTSVARRDGMIITPATVNLETVLFSSIEADLFREYDEPWKPSEDKSWSEPECGEESTLETVLSLHIGKITASNAFEAIDLIKRTFNVR